MQIVDRLKDRLLGAHENIGDRRRQQRARVRLHGGDDVGANKGWRDLLVAASGRIGVEIGERRRIGRPVPDDVVVAFPRPQIAVARRHRIGHREFATRNAERVALEQQRPVGRDLGLGGESAPGDIARIVGLDLRQNLRADRGTRAIGGDQQVAGRPRPIGEDRRDAAPVLFGGDERFCRVIVLRRQGVLERTIEPRPGGHDAWPLQLAGDLAARVEPDIEMRVDAERGTVIDPKSAQHAKQRVMRAETGAAPGKVLRAAFEHVDLPAGRAQQVRGEQPAERAADNQCVAVGGHSRQNTGNQTVVSIPACRPCGKFRHGDPVRHAVRLRAGPCAAGFEK